MEPLISVIVPVYNVEKYLDKCIESIVNQTYKNLEIILVDDGSPDNCPQICDAWAEKDNRIKAIHKKNGGVSSARNAGIANSLGEYITFVDGDDMIESDMYEILVKDSVENLTDISCCTFKYVNEYYEEIKKDVRPMTECDTYFTSQEICDEYFKQCNGDLVSLCNKIIKRSLFDGLSFPLNRVFEDWTLAPMLYYKSSKTSYLPVKKYVYVIHSGSTVRTHTVKRYADCVSADVDHYNFFNSKKITCYNSSIECFICSDFFKCCKVYSACKNDKLLIKQAYKECKKICSNKKIVLFYYMRNVISLLYRIKETK